MKTQIVFALLFVSLNVRAQTLPDPLSCGAEHPGAVVLAHSGNEFIAKLETYQTILQFPAPGVMTLSTDWGPDVSEQIDANSMRNTWQTGGLAKFALAFDGNYACLRPDRADKCASSMANTLNMLSVVERRLLPGQGEEAHAALRCARSVVVSFMERSFASHDGLIARMEDVQLRPLSDEQVSNVTGRIFAIKKARDAERQAAIAAALAISASSSSSSSSSRRR